MKKNILSHLEKEIKDRKKANANNSVISEVNKLLEYDSLRDQEILKTIGANSTLVQSEKERGEVLELEKKENYYSGNVFSRSQIVGVATKYRLKFLPSKLYKSYLPPVIASDIKELERIMSSSMTEEQARKRNVSVEQYVSEHGEVKYTFDRYQMSNDFFILAPEKCFKLEETKAFTLKSPDPILFYRIDDNHFRVIRKWGSDFTIFRRFRGIALKSKTALFLTMILSILTVSLSLSLLFSWDWMWLMFLVLPCVPAVYAVDWDDSFFGKKYVESMKGYYY